MNNMSLDYIEDNIKKLRNL